MKSPIVSLRVARPEVMVHRGAKRPAAADVRELSQLARKGLGVLVPLARARVLESTGKVRGAACTQVTVKDHEQIKRRSGFG